MARKEVRHADGSIESWDDFTGQYVHLDPDGVELEFRELSQPEREQLDPIAANVRQLQEVVDQMLLEQLMSSFGAEGDLGDLGLA
jgi:hypothetical protein